MPSRVAWYIVHGTWYLLIPNLRFIGDFNFLGYSKTLINVFIVLYANFFTCDVNVSASDSVSVSVSVSVSMSKSGMIGWGDWGDQGNI